MNKLSVINPNAAGIDIGSEFHYVCVPEGCSEPRVRKFACFTKSHSANAKSINPNEYPIT